MRIGNRSQTECWIEQGGRPIGGSPFFRGHPRRKNHRLLRTPELLADRLRYPSIRVRLSCSLG